MRSLIPLTVGLLFSLLTGCDNTTALPVLHPLSGTIQRSGKPVQDGGIILLPESGSGSSLIVNSAVAADGTFTVRTERTLANGSLDIKPGAPAGRYRVVYHPASNGATMGLEVELAERVTVEVGGTVVVLRLPAMMPQGRGEPRDDDEPVPLKKE